MTQTMSLRSDMGLCRGVNPVCGSVHFIAQLPRQIRNWNIPSTPPFTAIPTDPHLVYCFFLDFPSASCWGKPVEFELRREIKRLQEYRAAGITNFCSKYLRGYSARSHSSRCGRMNLQHLGCVGIKDTLEMCLPSSLSEQGFSSNLSVQLCFFELL